MSLLQVFRICTTKCNTILRLINGSLVSMIRFMEVSLLVYITTISLILIVICNCSILNPGPNINTNSSSDSCFKIFYQNVHGFITYGSLGNKYPVLNITKLLEFQAYVSINQPDIIVLNETWLKHTITDAEIFPNNDNKIFRVDRTADSHPPEPNIRNKFKQNGGGILIAVNSCLDMKPKSLKSSSKTEILSILLQLKNNKKICITTCYRVGTLGEKNLAEISKHIDLVSSTKSIICNTLIVDMNLDSVNWSENSSSSPLHRQFLNIFDNHNLTQLINLPTHYLGNTLDILLCNTPSTISNIIIGDYNEHIKSDHFSITFDINFKKLICRNKGPRREIRNYKKANWREINIALNRINWDNHIDYLDIDTAWNNFKETLNSICNQHIPSITIQQKQNLPWFDSDIHKLCLKKERLRQKYKHSHKTEHYKKYSETRKDIKAAIKSKMRATLNDPSNPNALTKKFWSYVKNISNSSRIPDSIYRNGVYANDHRKQADLFNLLLLLPVLNKK